MSGLRGVSPTSYAPNKGRLRLVEPCLSCGQGVVFFERPRLVLCRGCWRSFWRVRDGLIRERLALAYPNAATDPEQRREARRAESRLRQDDGSIPDVEILPLLPRRATGPA